MTWFLVLLAMLYQYGIVATLIKVIGAQEGSRTRKLVWQFFFAALMSGLLTLMVEPLTFCRPGAIILVIGALNAFGCYCLWRAFDISLSKTAMLSPFDDYMAIIMGYVFLGEAKFLTPSITIGVLISAVSAVVFGWSRHQGLDPGKNNLKLLRWVAGYSIVWGLGIFSIRFFALQEFGLLNFMAYWYAGSWLGSLILIPLIGKKEYGPPLIPRQYVSVFLLSLLIWSAMILAYWMRTFLPITIVQPVQLTAGMVIPTLIGLVFIKEWKGMTTAETVVIIAGITGAIIITINF